MSTNTKIIAIVGVTGNQGSSVASTFVNTPGWTVRGITRDPSKPSSKSLVDKGVNLVAGDLDDVKSTSKAFEGADVVFGNTDFWGHFMDPATHSRAAQEGRAANEVAHDLEVTQGKRMIDAVATTTSTLSHFILSTLSDTKSWSRGKITFNLHFDAKAAQVEYLKETYPKLWAKTSLLQLGVFASNWKMPGAHAPVKVEGKEGEYLVRMAMSGDTKFPMVDVNADTGKFVSALVSLPPGKNLLGAGSVLSWNDWCAIWAKHNRVKCAFERRERKELEDGMGPVGREFADMFQYMDDFGYDGGDPSVVYPWDLGFKVEITTVEEYVKGQDWSSIL